MCIRDSPFTRYLAGAGDYTLCYFNNRVKNTKAHQLAMAAVYYSPLQFMFWYDRPEFYLVSYTHLLLGVLLRPKFGGYVSADKIGLPVTETGLVLPCGSTAIWSGEPVSVSYTHLLKGKTV